MLEIIVNRTLHYYLMYLGMLILQEKNYNDHTVIENTNV